MTKARSVALVVVALAALSGCLRRFAPAPLGTPLDDACNPMNGELTDRGSVFELGPAVVATPKGWSSFRSSPQDLQLTRLDTELNVWYGGRFIFPTAEPQNAIRCTITRGDTVISIQATRLNSFSYRVDASWAPPIEGQNFYMQLQTRYASQLKTMRGMIEAVRFVSDTMHGARVKVPGAGR